MQSPGAGYPVSSLIQDREGRNPHCPAVLQNTDATPSYKGCDVPYWGKGELAQEP